MSVSRIHFQHQRSIAEPPPRYKLAEFSKNSNTDSQKMNNALEKVKIKPFTKFDTFFSVYKRNLKWYLCDLNTAESHYYMGKQFEQNDLMELRERQLAARLIQNMGQQLRVKQDIINSAIVYMHRFYIIHPIKLFDYESIAAASLHLACKYDSPRRFVHIATVLARALKLNPSADEIESKRKNFVLLERFMLKTLANGLTVEDPLDEIRKACKLFNITNSKYFQYAV